MRSRKDEEEDVGEDEQEQKKKERERRQVLFSMVILKQRQIGREQNKISIKSTSPSASFLQSGPISKVSTQYTFANGFIY